MGFVAVVPLVATRKRKSFALWLVLKMINHNEHTLRDTT